MQNKKLSYLSSACYVAAGNVAYIALNGIQQDSHNTGLLCLPLVATFTMAGSTLHDRSRRVTPPTEPVHIVAIAPRAQLQQSDEVQVAAPKPESI